ncbi:MAG: hypothetical protein U0894_10180 [Pirellulales bacterium]
MSIAAPEIAGRGRIISALRRIDPELMPRGVDGVRRFGYVAAQWGQPITLLTICGLTHRQSYLDIAVVSVICPLIAAAVVIAAGVRLRVV